MSESPSSRSKKYLENLEGCSQGHVWNVEKWIPIKDKTGKVNPFGKKLDLFNFADLVALLDGKIVAIQTTSYSNMSPRRTKILAEPRAKRWLECGGRILIHGWDKKPIKPGSTRHRHILNEEEVLLEDFK